MRSILIREGAGRSGASARSRRLTARLVLPTTLLVLASAIGGPAVAGGSAQPAVGEGDAPLTASSASPPSSGIPYSDGVIAGGKATTVEPKELLVRFRDHVAAGQQARARSSAGATLVRAYKLVPGLQLLRTSSAARGAAAAAALSSEASVQYAVPDLLVHTQVVPNDQLYSQQWGPPSIRAPEAWGFATGSKSVVVAVLDTGITLNHPDLEANIWTNPEPGKDGYTGDVHGWNFVAGNANPADDNGHGTHVSGIIGAVGNDGIGVAGVNWSVSLMALKICNAGGECSLSDEIAALEYAVAHGARVANASFGGDYGGYPPEQEAIAAAGKDGLLYVAAAGNAASNDDVTKFYPADYGLENEISVAATTAAEGLASFSNYGFDSVELGAPGQNILSTLPTSGVYSSGTGYGELSGTSMATPQVTGAAALLFSEHGSWSMQKVRSRLLSTTRPLASLAGKVTTCGELDVGAAANPAIGDRVSLCVSAQGTGAGTVKSTPVGIDCGSICSASFAPGTQITLSAEPAPGSRFLRWGGACSGSGACTVAPSAASSVSATFQTTAGVAGWEDAPIPPPTGHEALAAGSNPEYSFYNLSISAAGKVRAKTIYNQESGCTYLTSNTGGVFLEELAGGNWAEAASLTAPALGHDLGSHWANCSSFGSVTALSGDGSTLLVTALASSTINPELGTRYRCAAFVYRRGAEGWKLDGTLFPPGVGVDGSTSPEACKFFGIGGAISADGTTVAILADGFVDVFAREGSGWALQQNIAQPSGAGCGNSIGPHQIALSGDGTRLLVSDPDCHNAAGEEDSGRLYAYARSGASWSLSQTIESPEPQFVNDFGDGITISGDGSTAAITVGRHVNGLPFGAGASWILRYEGGSWHFGTRLAAPTPTEQQDFSCPTILEDASRIICHQTDTVGADSLQGSMYLFDRPAGGWSSSPAATRLYAADGAAGDRLGTTGYYKWPAFAATADGDLIDATISVANNADGTYPNDRIGYDFTTVAAPSITSVSPAYGEVGNTVRIDGTSLGKASAVSFGSVPAQFEVASRGELTATVPAGASTAPISVTTPQGTATAAQSFGVYRFGTQIQAAAGESVANAGEPIHDTATLSGGSGETGTITFELYAASDQGCATPLAGPVTTDVSGDGRYESPSIVISAPGAYQWVASYSGDELDSPAAGECDSPGQQVRLRGATTLLPIASPAPHKKTFDRVTLEGGSTPAGTITFELFGPSDPGCAHVARAFTIPVNGDRSYESPAVKLKLVGTYEWVASYSGDGANQPARTTCEDSRQRVVLAAKPHLTTHAEKKAPLGTAVHDTAALSKAAEPAGTITFRIYAASDMTCSTPIGEPLTVAIIGNGSYQSPGLAIAEAGAYEWLASYSGDAQNEPVAGKCGAHSERVAIESPPSGALFQDAPAPLPGG